MTALTEDIIRQNASLMPEVIPLQPRPPFELTKQQFDALQPETFGRSSPEASRVASTPLPSVSP